MSEVGSFHSATEKKLRNLVLLCPTFKAECEAHAYIWLQIQHIEGVKLWKDSIEKVKRERLEMLPKKQMDCVGGILHDMAMKILMHAN